MARAVVDKCLHALDGGLVDERTDLRVGLERIAHLQGGRFRGELAAKRLGDRLFHDDPFRGHADLPLIHEGAEIRGRYGGINIGVVEHDHGSLAAQFQTGRA